MNRKTFLASLAAVAALPFAGKSKEKPKPKSEMIELCCNEDKGKIIGCYVMDDFEGPRYAQMKEDARKIHDEWCAKLLEELNRMQ